MSRQSAQQQLLVRKHKWNWKQIRTSGGRDPHTLACLLSFLAMIPARLLPAAILPLILAILDPVLTRGLILAIFNPVLTRGILPLTTERDAAARLLLIKGQIQGQIQG